VDKVCVPCIMLCLLAFNAAVTGRWVRTSRLSACEYECVFLFSSSSRDCVCVCVCGCVDVDISEPVWMESAFHVCSVCSLSMYMWLQIGACAPTPVDTQLCVFLCLCTSAGQIGVCVPVHASHLTIASRAHEMGGCPSSVALSWLWPAGLITTRVF
jgi:hypothetical protein